MPVIIGLIWSPVNIDVYGAGENELVTSRYLYSYI